MLKTSTNSRYSLKDEDIIPENVQIKNQGKTNSCWAFATLGVLETNLAMLNKKNSNPLEIFDFSERHMVYSSSRTAFKNEQINENGYNIIPSDGGNYYQAQAYLTNGGGAINESDMPFVNDENNIDISTILNQEIKTTLYDAIEIEKPSSTATSAEKQATIEKMKTHISNYGGLYAGIHAANMLSSEYYNNSTGAIYCSDETSAPLDHAVLIIGWDDNYDKTSFNAKNSQPTNNGAWIIKNSWGEKITLTIDEAKKEIFEENKEEFEEQGINSSSEINDEVVIEILEESGYEKQTDNTYSLKIGDNGYMYVSYEDANIYSTLWGIQKAKAEKDYENVYQNDILGISNCLTITTEGTNKHYLANAFKRDATENESVDRISVYTLTDYNNCKVYINPNGSSKQDLIPVSLKMGETIDLAPGYHTIEFEEPIKLTGNSFVVILEVEADGYFIMTMESNLNNTWWGSAEVNANESFFTTDIDLQNNKWNDTATWTKAYFNDTSLSTTDADYQGNVNIKAYTVKNEEIVNDGEDEENKYTYYYCLSENSNEENIKDEYWIEISSDRIIKESDGTYSITLHIDQNDLKNFEQIEDSEYIYLFIKEVAEINDKKLETVNDLKITLDVEPEINLVSSNLLESEEQKKDNTVANKILPNAGEISIIILVVGIILVGSFTYFRYKNIDR